ncbi:MAG: ester cyclase [Propionibacteriales bacterium]|nr:ester cyclase [Propionibacteriales bacterium]
MTADAELRARREAVIIEHMESENVHDYDVTMATFSHPRYEIVPTGDVFDGTERVLEYFAESRTAFPDQRNELIALHHADDSIVVEFMLLGTHLGPFRGLPATGRSFEVRCIAVFQFDDGTGVTCERPYFDSATILRQLGIAHDPLTRRGRLATLANHPVTIGTAVGKDLLRRVRRR